ncbi:MAG: hypothetical protein U9P14_09330 [Gemmatimonadota bacterium]|nr:hypothetical protein [Gemmatimonadota bacterium]
MSIRTRENISREMVSREKESREKHFEEISPGLWARREPPPPGLDKVDAVIFDIDGVLVDVSESFPHVLPPAVQYYFNNMVGVPGSAGLVTAESSGVFKLAGRYNNDWDVANGAVCYGLLKLLSPDGGSAAATPSMETIASAGPSLEEFTAEIKTRGGGLDNTLVLMREKLGEEKFEKFRSLYQPGVVKKIFMEHYAGRNLCRTFYGCDPEYYSGPGLAERELYLPDLPLLEDLTGIGVGLGVLSGRTIEEAEYVLGKMGLDQLLPAGWVVLDDGALPGKPDPAGLRLLERRMGFERAVYVGDTPDDWTTVENFRAGLEDTSRIAGCQVETGASNTPRLIDRFEEDRVDYLATDVNCFLRALAAVKEK